MSETASDNFESVISGLAPERRRQLLAKLRQRDQAGSAVRFPPERLHPAGEPAQLSFTQERMWLLDHLDPNGAPHNIHFALRVRGRANQRALHTALDEIVRRHHVLRTVFTGDLARPRQTVRPPVSFELPVIPLTDGTATVADHITQLGGQRLDLAEGPLIRATLLSGTQEDVLVVVVHHAVFDGSSIDVFVSELVALYRAAVDGRPADVLELPAQYSDWATFQRSRFDGRPMADLLGNWKRRLADAPALSTLPPDFPRQSSHTRDAGHCAVTLPPDVVTGLEKFARAQRTTPNVVVMAAIAALLQSETGSSDILLGVPVAGRTHMATESLIGCFENTVVVRMDLPGEPTPVELIRHAHRTFAESYQHQDAPFVQVVETVAPARTLNSNPLFQILFSLSGAGDTDKQTDDDLFTPVPVAGGAAEFDMLISLTHRAGEVVGTAGYDAALYLPGTVAGFFTRLSRVLTDFFEHPERPLPEAESLRREEVRLWTSFPAESMAENVRTWLRTLRARADLLVEDSAVAALAPERPGAAVCLVRWQDRLADVDPQAVGGVLAAFAGELVAWVTAAAEAGRTVIVGLCPPSPAFAGEPWAQALGWCDDAVVASLDGVDGVEVVRPDQWTTRYRVSRAGRKTGDGPYSLEFSAAAATEVVRRLSRPAAAQKFVLLADSTAVGRTRALMSDEDVRSGRHVFLVTNRAAVESARAAFPGVVVLHCPTDDVERFTDHLWVLDEPRTRPGLRTVQLDSSRLEYIANELASPSAAAMRTFSFAEAEAGTRETIRERTLPRDEMERRVTEIWRDFLPGASGDVREDFFAAGGHSMLALQLLGSIRERMGATIPLAIFFAQPTIACLARALQNADTVVAAPIPALSRDCPLEPSLAQQRYWTASRFGDEPNRFNITFAARLRGALDKEALRTAVAAVVRRHEVLRSTFPEVDGRPSVVFHDRGDHWLPTLDISGIPQADRLDAVDEYIHEHSQAAYNLASGPLLRVRLLTESPDLHYLLLGMHHIVSDNSSWTIFLRELEAFYEIAAGRRAQLPEPLPIQFADYAMWQRGWLTGAEAAEHLAYWKEMLAGVPMLSATATDRPRPATTTNRARHADRLFSAELGPALKAMCRATGMAPFTALATAFGALLRRYGCQQDLVVGTSVGGRYRAEVEPLIGCLSDLLPIRLDVPLDATFEELANGVRTRVTGAQGHQEIPFAAILDEVRPQRGSGQHPMFQTVLNYLSPSVAVVGGIPLEQLEVPDTGLDFDLFLTVSWFGDRLLASLRYSADLYEPATAGVLLGAFEALLADAVSGTDRTIADVPLGESFAVPRVAPHAEPVAVQRPAMAVTLASTFTAEPVVAGAKFWLAAFGIPSELAFAPFSQVVQPLLDSGGPLHAEPDAHNVILVRWQDLLSASSDGQIRPAAAVAALDRALQELLNAVKHHREWSNTPLTIGFCPPSKAFRGAHWDQLFSGAAARFVGSARRVPDVAVSNLGEFMPAFRVTEIDDPLGDDLARMPYSREAFAVLGTALAFAMAERHGRPVDTVVVGPGVEVTAELAGYLRGHLRAGRRLVLTGERVPDELVHPRSELVSPQSFASLLADGATGFDILLVRDQAAAGELRAVRSDLTHLVAPTGDLSAPLWGGHGPTAWRLPDAVVYALARGTDGAALVELVSKVQSGRADTGDHVAPTAPAERALAEIVADLLREEKVSVTGDFFTMGGDSLLAIQLVSRAARVGLLLTPQMILAHRDVRSLVEAAGQSPRLTAAAEYSGPFTPTVGQQWFFGEIAPTLPNPSHFNHPYYVTLLEPVSPAHLERALEVLLRRHESLRSRYTRTGDAVIAHILPAAGQADLTYYNLADLDHQARDDQLLELTSRAQTTLDLAAGPVHRAFLFDLGPNEPQRLLLLNHHAVVDGVSRGVLLSELELLLGQLERGQEPALPETGMSLAAWSKWTDEYARSARLSAQASFWLAQGRPAGSSLVVDHESRPVTIDTIRIARGAVSPARTARLRDLARRSGLRFPDLLAAAVASRVATWSGGDAGSIYLVTLGRPDYFPDVDVSQTVGWFQSQYPVAFTAPTGSSAIERAISVGAQLNQAPDGGIGYATLLYQSPWGDVRHRLQSMPKAQVSFNYMGDFGLSDAAPGAERFMPARGSFGHSMDERGTWPHLLDFIVTTQGGGLRIEVNYSYNVFRGSTVDRMLDELDAEFERIIEETAR